MSRPNPQRVALAHLEKVAGRARAAAWRLDVRKFAQTGDCPFCGHGTAASMRGADTVPSQAWDTLECSNCGGRWMAVYPLGSLEVQREPRGEPDRPALAGYPLAGGRRAATIKTAGEVRFIKDRSGDTSEWGWNGDPPPSGREIDQSGFDFNPKNLKPLARALRSTVAALGHVTSANHTFVKVKSADVSPDGALGGKGYIMKIGEMRRQFMNCMEVLSALSDTLYDELKAPHWTPVISEVDPRERDQVKDIIEDAEDIKQNPEGYAKEEEAEMDSGKDDPGSSTPGGGGSERADDDAEVEYQPPGKAAFDLSRIERRLMASEALQGGLRDRVPEVAWEMGYNRGATGNPMYLEEFKGLHALADARGFGQVALDEYNQGLRTAKSHKEEARTRRHA